MAFILILAERRKADPLSALLLREGYQTAVATDWEEGLVQLEEQPVDLLLLAVPSAAERLPARHPGRGSPGRPGADVAQFKEGLRRLREVSDLPAIALVPEERLAEWDWFWGINDFVTEPLRPAELVARLRRLSETYRLGPGAGSSQSLTVMGDLVIDGEKYQVYLAGHPVPLTFKEFELLKFLASRPGKVFSRQTLLSQVWGYDYFGGERTVDVHIRRLRSKIEDRTHSFIDTVRNVGYRFKG